MDAAGVLPRFTGTAVHDAWAPYDTYTNVTHALRNAHALRELVYVVDTAPEPVKVLATQAIDALVEIKDLVAETTAMATVMAATTQPAEHLNPHDLTQRTDKQAHVLRSALVLGKNATAGRATKLEAKYNTLFTRMINRWEDYQRFTHDPAVSFDNNAAEQPTAAHRWWTRRLTTRRCP